MIKDLPNTTISKVSKELVQIREEGGAVALGPFLRHRDIRYQHVHYTD